MDFDPRVENLLDQSGFCHISETRQFSVLLVNVSLSGRVFILAKSLRTDRLDVGFSNALFDGLELRFDSFWVNFIA